ncbi:unnamed protein product [Caenorhabditis brenneri]
MNSLPSILAQKPHGKKNVPQIRQNEQIINKLETELKASRNALKTEKAKKRKLMDDMEKICNEHIVRMNENAEVQRQLFEQLKAEIDKLMLYSKNQSSFDMEQHRKNANRVMFPCEICLQPYSHELKMTPRVLVCGHTLRFSCAERLVDKGVIKCPFDRTPTKLGYVDIERGLPRNYAVLNMCT